MKHFSRVLVATAIVVGPVLAPSVALAGVKDNQCKLTGTGTIASGDTLVLSVKANNTTGAATGTVQLNTATGDIYDFSVTFMSCRRDGGGGPGAPGGISNIPELEGSGTKNGVAGYDFAATVHDHGEGSTGVAQNLLPDEFGITAAVAPDDVVIDFQASGLLVSGNFQVQSPG
jgi:hypothetical protein